MNTPIIESGIASLTMPGQSQSGDRHVVHPCLTGVMLAAIDGLGHGQEAATAADLAATILTKHAQESMIAIVKHCHAQLRETRGVVMSLAVINALEGGSMVFEMGDRKIPFTTEDFLMSFSLPNFYFHAATTYDILRMKGAPLGKRDFMGRLRIKS